MQLQISLRLYCSTFHADGGDAGAASANGAGRGPKSPSGSGLLSDREQQLMDLIKVNAEIGRWTVNRSEIYYMLLVQRISLSVFDTWYNGDIW